LEKAELVEHGVEDVEADEPLEEQVVLEPLAELAFAPHRVEGLEQHRFQQMLWRDRRTADVGVHRVELRRERGERAVHDRPDLADRVSQGDQRIRRHRAEHLQLLARVSAHRLASLLAADAIVRAHGSRVDPLRAAFSTPC